MSVKGSELPDSITIKVSVACVIVVGLFLAGGVR